MRVLRTSCWSDMISPPITLIIRDVDAQDSLESAAAQAHDWPKVAATLGEGIAAFIVNDIFDMEDADVEVAGMRAMSRVDPQEEQNMAVLFYFTLEVLRVLLSTGVYMAPDPAPLTAQQIVVVFEQLRANPAYEDGQTLSIYSTEEDDSQKLVTMAHSEITVDGETV